MADDMTCELWERAWWPELLQPTMWHRSGKTYATPEDATQAAHDLKLYYNSERFRLEYEVRPLRGAVNERPATTEYLRHFYGDTQNG